jgi:hypothetical protein
MKQKISIMKKILLTITLVLIITLSAGAQDYRTGIGVRGGLFTGLTLKHFISERAAIEGLFETRWSGLGITGLYEIHANAFDVDRLNWYYGIGGHVGFYNGDNTTWGTAGTSYSVLGVDGILGIEYNIGEIPINISLDWKPVINLINYGGFWGDGGALSIRYIF